MPRDNRYTESTTSMSTTSSEGYDEGLGEEKAYKDRSHSEKISSMKVIIISLETYFLWIFF